MQDGLPNSDVTIVDISLLIDSASKGLTAVLGPTLMGDVLVPKQIFSWPEFEKHYGGLFAASDFPLYCKRALDAGGKLLVGRAAHYTDATDKSTITGTKPTAT